MARIKKGEFKQDVIGNVMFRAGLICSNPCCMVLTVGPVTIARTPAIKIGEAAHIVANADGGPRGRRLDADLSRHYQLVSSEANAIWLCASCHTKIDKNNGDDFPERVIRQWKADHEKLITGLYRSKTSPVPHLRRMTDEGAIAQRAVGAVEDHGMLIVPMQMENPAYVLSSIKDFRRYFERLAKEVQYDEALKSVLQAIASHAKGYMNITSTNGKHWSAELETFRRRCAVYFQILVDDWKCKPGPGCQRLISEYK